MSFMPTRFLPSLRRASAATFTLAVLAVLFVSCGGEDSKFIPFQPQPDSTQDSTRFVGFLADGDAGARLDIIIDSPSLAARPFRPPAPSPHVPAPTVAAVAFLRWQGGDVAMTGVYDFTADTLYLAGAGRELRGNLEEIGTVAIIDGRATTPNGPAGFMAIRDSDTTKVARAWVGTFQATSTTNAGTLCMLQSNNSVMGHAFNAGADAPMSFAGTIFSAGAMLSIAFGASAAEPYTITADGNVNLLTGAMSGDYTFQVTDAAYGPGSEGTWSATRR